MAFGTGKHTYEVAEGWGQLPAGWEWAEVSGVAVDSQDRVYMFNRGSHPVIVFDREGNFLTSWGEGMFTRAHGIYIGPDDSVYCADDGDHTVRRFTTDGKLLMTLGTKNKPSDSGYVQTSDLTQSLASIKRGAPPFNRPTKLALAPSGEMYVSDGYGNARVHKFTADGIHLLSWGEPGTGPGQFVLPHSVWVDKAGRVLVADRENHRVQTFSSEGKFLAQWTGFVQPSDIFIDAADSVFVAELGNRVSILDLEGRVLARLGGELSGPVPRVHGLGLDSRGDIYVTGIREARNLSKFVRKG